MGRPKSNPPEMHSKMAGVRLRDQEWAGLKQLAEDLNETPSRIIRRLVREAITGGPDYFDDGLLDLRRMSRALNSIGSNLNQLSRAANRGGVVSGDDVRRVINAGLRADGSRQRAVRAGGRGGNPAGGAAFIRNGGERPGRSGGDE